MYEDGIEIACHLSERHGSDRGGQLLVDLCLRQPPSTSFVLQSTPPVFVAAAAAPHSEALLGAVTSATASGLVTLTPARVLSGDIGPVRIGDAHGEAAKLTVYCGHRDRVFQVPVYEAVCELLYRRGVAGATVLPGLDGSIGGQRHRAGQMTGHLAGHLRHDADAPLAVVAVGADDQIGMLLSDLGGLFRHPVFTLSKVRVCKRDGAVIGQPDALFAALLADSGAGSRAGSRLLAGSGTGSGADSRIGSSAASGAGSGAGSGSGSGAGGAVDLAGQAALVKLTVYTSEAARQDHRPVHQVIASQARAAGASAVTTARGIWGYHADRAPHGDHFPHLGHHVPGVTTVIDTPERIAAAFDIIDGLTRERGLVTAETVLTPRPADAPG